MNRFICIVVACCVLSHQQQTTHVEAFQSLVATTRHSSTPKIRCHYRKRRQQTTAATTTTTRRQVPTVLQSQSVPQNDDDDDDGATSKSAAVKRFPKRRLKFLLDYVQQKQQYTVVLLLYLFHLAVLTQHELVFPVQLIPNDKGHFTGIGWDSLAGIVTLGIYRFLRQRRRQKVSADSSTTLSQSPPPPLPSITGTPTLDETPWNLPRNNNWHRLTSVTTALVLIRAYFETGRFSIFWEDLLYDLSGLGFFITAPMQRSLCVLLGHLSWLVLGALLLRWLPRPPKFFQAANHHHHIVAENNNGTKETAATKVNDDNCNDNNKESSSEQQRPHVWFRSSRRSKWLWWVIGGYFVSSLLFNMADLVNQYILPEAVLEEAQESVVSQLVNPEHNDWLASAVGYVAPCITAPWWEEVLYRGFALPGLTQLFGYRWAVLLQGVIFSAHHMSLSAALPLAVLGWTWAILYTKSKNLWVVVAVHALWNSRVFLGSWLGL